MKANPKPFIKLKTALRISIFCLTQMPGIIAQGPDLPRQGAWAEVHRTEGPSLVFQVGPYRLRFAEKPSWTLRELLFSGKVLLSPSGWMQPVLFENNVPKGSDPFLGTGHRPESDVKVEVTDNQGKSHAVTETLNLPGSPTLTLHKTSVFQSAYSGPLYQHEAWVGLGSNGLTERYRLTPIGPGVSNIAHAYVFMHIFSNTTKSWMVLNEEGKFLQGEFLDDNSFSLRKDISGAFIFDPTQQVGFTLRFPEVYVGKPGFKNSFWNRPHDNKLYLQVDPPRKEGAVTEYRCSLAGVSVAGENWESEAKHFLGDIHLPLPQAMPPHLISNRASPALQSILFTFDTATGLSFQPGEAISLDGPRAGPGCFEMAASSDFAYRKFPLTLKALTQYRIKASLKKEKIAKGDGSGTYLAVVNYTPEGNLEIFVKLGASAPRDHRWHDVEGVFTSGSQITDRCGLVLYNSKTAGRAWFDEVSLGECP